MNEAINHQRQRGRPRDRDDLDLRQRLIDSAERLFAERGFEATSLRSVAETAQVNPALINYYFGSKQGLLEAVFEEALEPLAMALAGLMQAPSARPDELVQLLYDLARAHPNLLPLLAREALLPGGIMRETFASRFAPRLGGRFPDFIRREQTHGRLRDSHDPEALTVMLLAMSLFPFLAGDLVQKILGLNMKEDGSHRLLDQLRRMLAPEEDQS